jgi:hypothetical protein
VLGAQIGRQPTTQPPKPGPHHCVRLPDFRWRCKVPKLSVVVMISWLFGALCGYGIAQMFDTGCDQSTEQPDTQ